MPKITNQCSGSGFIPHDDDIVVGEDKIRRYVCGMCERKVRVGATGLLVAHNKVGRDSVNIVTVESTTTDVLTKAEALPTVEAATKTDIMRAVNEHIEPLIDGLNAQANKILKHRVTSMIDTEVRIERKVDEFIESVRINSSIPVEITVRNVDTKEVKKAGFQHRRFGDLLQLVKSNLNVALVGPAGSGKSHAAQIVAEVLSMDFHAKSLGPQTSQSDLWGYMDAQGRYVPSAIRQPYEFGGIMLLDELDRCNDRVLVTMNAAIANGIYAFPDGMIKRHKDCIIIATMNTTGHGADRVYTSARQQDGSTMNRFAQLKWGYDEKFERMLATAIHEPADPWVDRVQAVRAKVEEFKMRYVVSPRQSLDGAKALAAGLKEKLIEETVLYAGWSDEDKKRVVAAL